MTMKLVSQQESLQETFNLFKAMTYIAKLLEYFRKVAPLSTRAYVEFINSDPYLRLVRYAHEFGLSVYTSTDNGYSLEIALSTDATSPDTHVILQISYNV